MAVGLTPLTELEAINEILATGSDSPISTLDENIVIDASLAKNTLRATSVEIQSRGWSYNTDDLDIEPDQDGIIRLPRNTLRLRTVGNSSGIACVQRGVRLWNKTDKTFKFDNPVSLEITLGLDFEELPSTARMYITIKAARKYQDRYFGDPASHSYSKEDEMEAHARALDEEIDSQRANMLTGSTFMRNLTS